MNAPRSFESALPVADWLAAPLTLAEAQATPLVAVLAGPSTPLPEGRPTAPLDAVGQACHVLAERAARGAEPALMVLPGPLACAVKVALGAEVVLAAAELSTPMDFFSLTAPVVPEIEALQLPTSVLLFAALDLASRHRPLSPFGDWREVDLEGEVSGPDHTPVRGRGRLRGVVVWRDDAFVSEQGHAAGAVGPVSWLVAEWHDERGRTHALRLAGGQVHRIAERLFS